MKLKLSFLMSTGTIGIDVKLFDPDNGMETIRHVDAQGMFHDFFAVG